MEPPRGLDKPHAVCVPFPAQGHITPMMNLAKLLHSRGFHVTFVLTHFNRDRLLRSRGPRALDGLPSFRFASIPDGLPPSDTPDATQPILELCQSMERHCPALFAGLLEKLNEAAQRGSGPRVTCIVSDVTSMFTLMAAEEFGIKEVLLWTASACSFLAYDQYGRLEELGYAPFKDASYLTNGCLDTPVDWIPSMEGIRLKDLPTFIRTTDPNDIMFNRIKLTMHRSREASAILFNTFDALEHTFLASLSPDFPPLFPIGPLHTPTRHIPDHETAPIGSNLWKEDDRCTEWLDSKEPGSVVYVNFGSITVMTNDQLVEFALGLAGSGKAFLWVIRPGLVTGESAVLPGEFGEETRGRSLLVDWCDQERVLGHVAVGGFLTHSGWNSTIESVCAGLAMITWPFLADQQTNCWACREVWGIGMEIGGEVKRGEVEGKVRELMDGEKGREMRRRAVELKGLAEKAVDKDCGESWKNIDRLISEVLLCPPE